MINFVREFNEKLTNIVLVVEFISQKRNDLNYDMENDCFKDHKGKVLILVKDNIVDVKVDVTKLAKSGKYTYFDFFCECKFKSSVDATINYIKYTLNEEELPFIRVGTDYYKVITQYDRYNIPRTKLKLWKLTEIKPYHGKDVIYEIPAYDDFCLEPNNVDYQPIINNCYNQHSEFMHQPSLYGGAFKWTEQLLRHVFGSQYEKGLIYMQCLYLYPKKALPILVFVSEERQTGKSTIIDYLTQLFGENMVVANPSDIGSSFNSSYSDKNIIAIEESRFDSVQTTEKLKNLATQKKILVNAKHQQPYSLPFFGKLIITSNDEQKFSKVDQQEIRYWVRKVPSLKGKANHDILTDLVSEIPNFLKHLLDMPIPDFSRSRMVFTAEDIETDALKVVKNESHTQLYKDIFDILEDEFNNNSQLETMSFTPLDMKRKYFERDNSVSNAYIKSVLVKEFRLKPKGNRRYFPFDQSAASFGTSKVGNAYEINRSYFDDVSSPVDRDQILKDAMMDGESDIAF